MSEEAYQELGYVCEFLEGARQALARVATHRPDLDVDDFTRRAVELWTDVAEFINTRKEAER